VEVTKTRSTACRIGVCEPVCYGLEHVEVNAGLLRLLPMALPHCSVEFAGERAHAEQLAAALPHAFGDAGYVRWQELHVPPRHLYGMRRAPLDWRTLAAVRWLQERGGPAIRIFLSGTATLLLALAARSGFRRMTSTARTWVVLHGSAAALGEPRARNPLRRLIDLQSALRRGQSAGLRYLVLEDQIRDAIQEMVPWLQGSVDAIPHPLPVNRPSTPPRPSPRSPVRIGFLGLASTAKGFAIFARLAEHCDRHHPPDSPAPAPTPWVRSLVTSDQVPRDLFIRSVEGLHYVCLPYEPGRYTFVASGVLPDAIAFARPVIAFPTRVISDFFRRHGDIGFLCRKESDLVHVVAQLAGGIDPERHERQVSNMWHLRQTREDAALAARLRDTLEVVPR
jgi:hypothetical protein